MKTLRKIALSFFMVLATSCSLLGGAHDAKAKEGWELLQQRKGETYYESCEWYHVIDFGAVISGQLQEADYYAYFMISRNGKGQEPNIYHGYLGKAAEEQN